MRSKTIHSMNTNNIDFFRSVLDLDSVCNEFTEMRDLQTVISNRIIKKREEEIGTFLADLGICLYEALENSPSFTEWFQMFASSETKTIPKEDTVCIVRIIETFKDPTGYICLTLDLIRLHPLGKARYAFGLWHREVIDKKPVFVQMSWTDDRNTLESLKRFPGHQEKFQEKRDLEGFARTLYCSSFAKPLSD